MPADRESINLDDTHSMRCDIVAEYPQQPHMRSSLNNNNNNSSNSNIGTYIMSENGGEGELLLIGARWHKKPGFNGRGYEMFGHYVSNDPECAKYANRYCYNCTHWGHIRWFCLISLSCWTCGGPHIEMRSPFKKIKYGRGGRGRRY